MKLIPDEKNLPRLHLIGTLAIVLFVIFMLAGLFAWQGWLAHRGSLRKIETAAQQQIHELITDVYTALPFPMVRVPPLEPSARVDYILARL